MCRINNLVKRLVKVGFTKEEAVVESWQAEVELSALTAAQKKKKAAKKKSKVPDKKTLRDRKQAIAAKKLFGARGSKGLKGKIDSKLKELGLKPKDKEKTTDKENNSDSKHWDMANVDDKARAKESGILGKLKKKKDKKKAKSEK